MSTTLPLQTVRDLSELVIHFTRAMWRVIEDIARNLGPWTDPPEDMEIRCRDGSRYSGFLMIEDNDITSGAVVRTGREAPRPSPYAPPAPPPRPWSGSEDRSHLSHWATDGRDEEDPPWARR